MKTRAQHSFQVSLINEALKSIDGSYENEVIVVDIGDSAGTHLQYVSELHQDRNLRCISINLEEEAVAKIKNKGMEAICARAEDLPSLSIDADIFLSFEMIEHLMNPCGFLHDLSKTTNCKAFIVTVPYLAHSRVGLHHIRGSQKRNVSAENTHIFELSPEDWYLIFSHSGWEVKSNNIYLQYPKRTPFYLLWKKLWRIRDFEGFYGAILVPNPTWSNLYNDW